MGGIMKQPIMPPLQGFYCPFAVRFYNNAAPSWLRVFFCGLILQYYHPLRALIICDLVLKNFLSQERDQSLSRIVGVSISPDNGL